jgi:hypothetical protein
VARVVEDGHGSPRGERSSVSFELEGLIDAPKGICGRRIEGRDAFAHGSERVAAGLGFDVGHGPLKAGTQVRLDPADEGAAGDGPRRSRGSIGG